ncbi:MarR family winged helix-turn-helix transcriptional regulator [Nocardia sp. NPDC057668]|uniref:MarR family winged helix-turn-helix transcriptional regulator n=1 Tax=Nocardia sp. NPDC057668 TaxID=3346202 RepID=UPI00367133A1
MSGPEIDPVRGQSEVTIPIEALEFEAMLLGRYSLISRKGVGQLDRSAYVLLQRLGDGPMSIGQLSEALGLDVSTLNRQTATMLKAGLLERIPDPDGGIARKFRATDAGRGRMAAERASGIHHLGVILSDWPESEIAALADHLRRFNSAIEHYHGRSWPRDGVSGDVCGPSAVAHLEL